MIDINLIFSGVMCYIFIIVFIGGLMVLLVRVASSVNQEQAVSPSLLLIIILLIVLRFLFLNYKEGGRVIGESSFNVISLLDFSKTIIVFIVLLVLVVCLFVITKLLLEYKGLTRSL